MASSQQNKDNDRGCGKQTGLAYDWSTQSAMEFNLSVII